MTEEEKESLQQNLYILKDDFERTLNGMRLTGDERERLMSCYSYLEDKLKEITKLT